MADAAERVADRWREQDGSRLVGALQEYVLALERYDADRELGVFDAGHALLTQAAREHDIIYKPCGAGGGDVGIAVGTDRDALAAFVEHATQSGFEQLGLGIDWRGAARHGDDA